MSLEIATILIASVFGAGGVATLVQTWFNRKRATADAMAVWSQVWNENLSVMKAEIDGLRARVMRLEVELAEAENRNRLLTSVLIENRIDIP